MMNTITVGNIAEQQAAQFLETQGLKWITSHFRSRCGEIDLIMEDQNTLVFVEVRLRKRLTHGRAAESVDFKKQHKITRTALFYLQVNQLFEKKACRFDVIDISGDKIDWIQNAF